jgi:hypothetical protein
MPKDIEQYLNESIGDLDAEGGAELEWSLWGRPADLPQLLSRISNWRGEL